MHQTWQALKPRWPFRGQLSLIESRELGFELPYLMNIECGLVRDLLWAISWQNPMAAEQCMPWCWIRRSEQWTISFPALHPRAPLVPLFHFSSLQYLSRIPDSIFSCGIYVRKFCGKTTVPLPQLISGPQAPASPSAGQGGYPIPKDSSHHACLWS